jgi:hypothetical protein
LRDVRICPIDLTLYRQDGHMSIEIKKIIMAELSINSATRKANFRSSSAQLANTVNYFAQ